MNEIEFARGLLERLDEKTFRVIMQKAVKRGFMVQGFTRHVGSAPKKVVSASLEKRGRYGEYQSSIFLSALRELNQEDPDNQAVLIARKWLLGGNSKIEAENELQQIQSGQEKKKEESSKNELEKEKEPDQSEEKEDVIRRQKGKIEKLQEMIKDLRMKVDNKEKEEKLLKKENNRLKRQIEEEKEGYDRLSEKYDTLVEEKRQLVEKLDANKQKILHHREMLKKAPRVLCFSKKAIDGEAIPFYNIDQLFEWSEQYEREIDWRKYKQIWVIETDFSYPEMIKIRNLPCKRIILSPNVKTLMEKIGGR